MSRIRITLLQAADPNRSTEEEPAAEQIKSS